MKFRLLGVVATLSLLFSGGAAIKVDWERNGEGATGAFRFKSVPHPQKGDAASEGKFSVIAGRIDANSGGVETLHDGRLPQEDDVPRRNFFFAAGTKGGRLLVDLQKVVPIAEVRSFSWHSGDRGPQVYKLYAIDQAAADPAEAQTGDPESLGWRLLASVDTREGASSGGQFAARIRNPDAEKVGDFRYLLFDISATEDRDPFGNTFFSEIDVITVGAVEEKEPALAETPILNQFEFGTYRVTIDSTAAPDLTDWSKTKLLPVIQEWYPKLVELLPGEDYQAPTNITVRFREDMGGTPASAGGSRINLNAQWFRKNLEGEAIGSVVHEMAHVVQNYGWGRRNNPNAARVPGWIVEGIPDYIRWFLFEPEKRGAEITARNLARARYDANYRISGNFLDWVARKHGRDVIWKLNAAARAGKYSPDLWTELTGQSVEELGAAWRKEHEERLGAK